MLCLLYEFILVFQVLDGQAECRDEALNLVVQLDSFLVVQDYMPQLQERKGTRSAVEAMLAQIRKASDYICQQTSASYMGMRSIS